ncbi:hypothetical protein R5R61_00020 [Oenococcus oeni]|uniref:L.oenos plasmid p4028 ORF1, ORF2, ORF3, ORF4, ORF5 genes n=1 Tax=Oenococcus oeni TaxID=1247 RepID=Q57149_OENOE|nr:hypothetical protein [Oenococcus oeni]AAB50433.1 unknown [Oenococcus oeni]OIL17880.1 hypothetical protein ATW99_09770 [Oenococcus oeni]OIL21360.1 hypothetical protein ATX01_10910 [Oenococcus oeni]OIL39747.1 hypothetical protein ATX13_10045 [Oenococcus oeni]OIL46252.1 hypothetical protein ATX17_09445 [Oenococcus oeni]
MKATPEKAVGTNAYQYLLVDGIRYSIKDFNNMTLKQGFDQAYKLAKTIQDETGWALIAPGGYWEQER